MHAVEILEFQTGDDFVEGLVHDVDDFAFGAVESFCRFGFSGGFCGSDLAVDVALDTAGFAVGFGVEGGGFAFDVRGGGVEGAVWVEARSERDHRCWNRGGGGSELLQRWGVAFEVEVVDFVVEFLPDVLADAGGVEGEDCVLLHLTWFVAGKNADECENEGDHGEEEREDGGQSGLARFAIVWFRIVGGFFFIAAAFDDLAGQAEELEIHGGGVYSG